MITRELEYELPVDLIAAVPPSERDGGRLLVADAGQAPPFEHATVRDLARLVPDNALLVVNDTRVIPARLHGTKQPSGGRVEIFLLRALDATGARWHAFGRANKPLRTGSVVRLGPDAVVTVTAKHPDGSIEVRFESDDPWAVIHRHGEVPLPPYLHRAPTEADRERYQTVFAAHPGAVAAPTAGLHLTTQLLDALAARGVERAHVTLHVGAGTFQPVTVEDLDLHVMHKEWFTIPEDSASRVLTARAAGRPIVAVGTTALRALETWGAVADAPRTGETALLVQPGYAFKVVDHLLTNFHLPRSTLLALVMAFVGVETARAAYASAIAARYRFFSYGDACYLRRTRVG